jgi:diguanylate cyclase (GGDEF)-like protein
VGFNTYLDLLLNISLGYGMVLLLMEDAKREVQDAHAELAVAHDRLRRESMYDSLTGSLNRRAFAEGVGLETAKGSFGAVALLDVDNLKPVNDGYGHRTGDAVLQHLVLTLRAELQPAERFFRWGGDEFLIVMPGTRAEDARERLLAALASCEPLVIEGVDEPLVVEASLGVADYASAEGLDASIDRADASMYAQKAQRRLARERSGTIMAAVA